jgi:hypothetical protein
VAGHQFPAFLNQNQKYFDSLRLQRDDLVATEKKVTFPVEPEPAELVNDPYLFRELPRARLFYPGNPPAPRLSKGVYFHHGRGAQDFP